MVDDAPFFYRRNPDRTIDAICTRCHSKICSVHTLSAVKEAECEHRCPGARPYVAEQSLAKEN
jgi:hypothetical protein